MRENSHLVPPVAETASDIIPTAIDASGVAPALESVSSTSALGTPFPMENIPSQPVQILHLPIERAQMLAALPRGKWSEGSSQALTGFLAALPSAIDAINHGRARFPFSLEGFEIFQLLICFGCLVWLGISLTYTLREKTSSEYFGELKRGTRPLE